MIAAPDILNASVLIVDDQESNISLIEQLLSEAGYPPDLAWLLSEGRQRQCERACARRDNQFAAIVHCLLLGGRYAKSRKGRQIGVFLKGGGPVLDE